MDSLFLKLANLALTGGAVVLVLLLLRPLLRRAPKWLTCLLWSAAAVRLAIPAAISTPIGLLRTSAPMARHTDGGVWLVSHIPAVDWYGLGLQHRLFYDNRAFAPDAIARFLTVLGVIWVIGTVIMLLYALISTLRLRRSVAESVPLVGWKRVRLCDHLPSPFLMGLLQPTIYLPSDLDDAERAHVIAHETAHLQRGDHWWKALGFLLLALFWPNPLLWLGYSRFCRDLELACDETVIWDYSVQDRRAYSETLLRCSAPKGVLSAPLAFGETGVKGRIQALARYRRPARWATLLMAAVCLLLGVSLATNHRLPTFEPDEASLPGVPAALKMTDTDLVSRLYDALQNAKPADDFARQADAISLLLRDHKYDECLLVELNADGTMMYYPQDQYADEPLVFRDGGKLYAMVQAIREDAPNVEDSAVNDVLRNAILAGRAPVSGTEFRCEAHDVYGVLRVRAGTWRICVHDLVWDTAETEPEQYRVLKASQRVEVFELTRHADGSWTAVPAPNALADFESELVNLRATQDEHTDGLVDDCCWQIWEKVDDLWLHFSLPELPPWEEG